MIVASCMLLACFLIGAIPFGYIIAKRTAGINIQEFGSGNIGSTNVGRIVGKKQALITQALDIAKGFVPSIIVLLLYKNNMLSNTPTHIPLLVAYATILGHDFTPFLKFHGGKGVNTTVGACLAVTPPALMVSVFAYFIASKASNHVSVGSMAMGIVLPVSGIVFYGPDGRFIFLFCAGVLLLLRHRDNIGRLLNGEEHAG